MARAVSGSGVGGKYEPDSVGPDIMIVGGEERKSRWSERQNRRIKMSEIKEGGQRWQRFGIT